VGLFDFIKSPKEREREELMNKIQKSIFPNGNSQIEKEVHEVRELLQFKYTKEDIKNTYIHAAAIFFVSEDKSEERIITSILLNNQSVVTKHDAIKLYGYIVAKFNKNPVPKAINSMASNISLSDRLFLVAKGGIVELKKHYKDLNDRGKYEVIILNCLICLESFYGRHPEKIQEVKNGVFSSLINQAKTYEFNVAPESLVNFIQTRFTFYANELSLITNSEGHIPGKLYSAIYINPLQPNPEPSYDLGEILLFQKGFFIMIKWVQNNANEV
jgi:hypothetical protein